MNRKLLASAICASLLVTGAAYAQDNPAPAQQSLDQSTDQSNTTQQQEKKKEPKTLNTVTVTGSLIPQSQIETASPVITITAQDLQKQGFKNVYDALRAMPVANGAVQDNQFTQGFTPGATTVSLLGLNPDFTLILLDGRPLADYPLLYNSTANFVDLGTIPTTLVDRIEIVPGNQSAIYGSAAIAGVVNIILKQHLEGLNIDYRAGGYTEGGGQQQRLQISGGHTFGKLDLMGAVEIDKQNPIYAYQRSYMASTLNNPNPNARNASRDRLELDAFTAGAVAPPPGACQAIGNLFNGTEGPAEYPNGRGPYCGSVYQVGQGTILNGNTRANFYGKATYQLSDNTQLYTDLLYNYSKVSYLTGGNYATFWGLGYNTAPYIYNLDSGHLDYVLQHVFAPEETGGQTNSVDHNRSWVFDAGIKGTFGNSNWNYDAYYHRSQYKNDSSLMRPVTDKVNAFFLGPQDGTDPFGYGYPAYHINTLGHFWGAVTPEQFRSFSDYIRSNSETYTQQGTATITNTDLFSLPAGSVGIAGQLTYGNQYWNNPIDPRVLAGDFWGIGGTSGEGKRNFSAAAIEFNVPIFKMLTADLSGRYDRYSPDGGSSQGKFTWKAGLEFRPLDTLLFRANYATAFRAPDMGYLFSAGSKSFGNVHDYYNCRLQFGPDYGACANSPYNSVQITTTAEGNKDLQYITAKSWGYGVVWSPIKNLTLKSDYYHVKIANEVSNYGDDAILQHEADCRLGETVQGAPVDINSPSCQQFLSQVTRTPLNAPINPGTLSNISTQPINISRESVSGIQASGDYRWNWGRFGDFDFGLAYAVQTSHLYQQFPGDQPSDFLRTNSYGNQFKNIGNATLSWDIGKWSTTLQYQRYGKTFSYDGSFTVGPWMKYNATVQYHVTPDITATLIGNNIFNARPPYDRSFTAYPYFDVFSYNPYGRLVMVELNIKLH